MAHEQYTERKLRNKYQKNIFQSLISKGISTSQVIDYLDYEATTCDDFVQRKLYLNYLLNGVDKNGSN